MKRNEKETKKNYNDNNNKIAITSSLFLSFSFGLKYVTEVHTRTRQHQVYAKLEITHM